MGENNTLTKMLEGKDLILFDGVCNLCSGTVNFILKRDADATFVFAPLQSDIAAEVLKKKGYSMSNLNSIILVPETGPLLVKSDAVLYIFKRLNGAWPILHLFRFIPRAIRDSIYDIIAKYRYKIFGKQEHCLLPTPALQNRFIDSTISA